MRAGIAVLHAEVAGTPLGPGLSPSVATAGDVLVTRLDDEIVRRRIAAHAERPTRPRHDETGRTTRFSRIRIARCAAAGRFSASPRGPSRHPQHSTFYRRCNSAVRPQSCRIHEESTPRPLRFPAPQHRHSAGHGPRCSRSSAVSARSRAAISWSRATMRGTRPVDRPGPGHVRETLSRAEAVLTASAPAVVEPRQARCLRHEATGCPAHLRGPSDPSADGHEGVVGSQSAGAVARCPPIPPQDSESRRPLTARAVSRRPCRAWPVRRAGRAGRRSGR
jgi:hypothetical protein